MSVDKKFHHRVFQHIGTMLVFVAATANAQSSSDAHPYLSSKFSIDVGVFMPQSTFKIGVGGTVDPAPFDPIDFETELRSDVDEEIAAIQFNWRFGEKWSLRAQYMEWNDRSSAVLANDVEWGDVTFGAGTGVGAGLDTSVTRLFFGRQFSVSDRHEFGLGLGGHVLDISAFIEGNAIVNGVADGFHTEVVSTSGLVPNIGGWYMYAFSERWAFTSRLDWLGADIGDYDGHIINASAGVNLNIAKHFGAGLNYNWLELDFGISDPNWHGDLNSRSHGFYAYLSAHW